MIIRIKSDNDYLMDVLNKNPDTDMGLYFKSLKNGQVAGNIVDKHHYEVVFQDEKYSYLPEESNQIDYQSYCSPLAALHICNELFAHILKSRDEFSQKEIKWLGRTQGDVDTVPCCIETPSFYMDSNWFRGGRFLLTKYFDGVQVEQQSSRIFRLVISAPSIFEAFNMFSLVSLFTHITNDYGIFTYIDDNLAQKYGRILTNIRRVPYFVFYLFILRAVKSEKQFRDLKPVFEKYLLGIASASKFQRGNDPDGFRFAHALVVFELRQCRFSQFAEIVVKISQYLPRQFHCIIVGRPRSHNDCQQLGIAQRCNTFGDKFFARTVFFRPFGYRKNLMFICFSVVNVYANVLM
jgi:hypothetical protein